MAGDREQMAADVADHLVNRLFAAGLALHSALAIAANDQAREHILVALNEIDAAIGVVRLAALGIDPVPTTGDIEPRG